MSDQHEEVQRILGLTDEEMQTILSIQGRPFDIDDWTPPTEAEQQAISTAGLGHDEYVRIRALPLVAQEAAINRLTVGQLRDCLRYDSRRWPAPMSMTAFHRPSYYVSRSKMVPKPTPEELKAMVRRLNDQGF